MACTRVGGWGGGRRGQAGGVGRPKAKERVRRLEGGTAQHGLAAPDGTWYQGEGGRGPPDHPAWTAWPDQGYIHNNPWPDHGLPLPDGGCHTPFTPPPPPKHTHDTWHTGSGLRMPCLARRAPAPPQRRSTAAACPPAPWLQCLLGASTGSAHHHRRANTLPPLLLFSSPAPNAPSQARG